MSWNYRIIRHGNGSYALHEVYYDDYGNPEMYTTEPITFVADSDEDPGVIARMLAQAQLDVLSLPVLDQSDFPAADEAEKGS